MLFDYDQSKVSRALDVIDRLRTCKPSDIAKDYVNCSLRSMESALNMGEYLKCELGNMVYLTVLSKAGILKDDPYKYFIDLVKKHHGSLSGRRIIEVASGIYPVVSEHLLKENPDIESIDVYDPILFSECESDPRIHIHQSKFDDSIFVDKDAIILSMQSCNSTFNILSSIKKNKVDSLVMLCSCDDSLIYDHSFEDSDITFFWYDDVCWELDKAKSDDFNTGFLSTKYKKKNPIPYFYTKRKYVDQDSVCKLKELKQ